MEKNTVQIKTKAGASLYIIGIGKVRSKINIPGCCSNARTDEKKDLKIVVRAVDNDTDPLAIITLFKFDKKEKVRKAEVSSAGTFSGVSDNNYDYVNFTGKKFQKASYILKIESIEPGEYGIIVRNPNNLDEKKLIVSTFGVD